MSDYIFKFTDPDKAPFIVKQYGANGPLTPNATTPLYPIAGSANTSNIFVGKGIPNYGDVVQTNVLHLTENFANSTAPAYAIEGQQWYKNDTQELFVYDSTVWNNVLVNNTSTVPFNMNSQRITGLGDPTDPTDATSLGYADATYVQLAGSTMTGYLVLSADPIADLQASTKGYVDDSIAAAVLTSGGSSNDYTDSQVALKVSKAGDTITGPLNVDATSINIINGGSVVVVDGSLLIQGTSSILDLGGIRLSTVGTPVANDDGTNKSYVDTAITSVLVDTSTYDSDTGVLTLVTANSTNIPLVSTPLAAFSHRHFVSDLDYIPLGLRVKRSIVADYFANSSVDIPDTIPFKDAVEIIAGALSELTSKTDRIVMVGSGTTTMTIPFPYPVNMDKLNVYKNGIKLYRSDRAESKLATSTPFFLPSITTLTNGTYTYDIALDGGSNSTKSVILNTTSGTVKYVDVLRGIRETLQTHSYRTVNFSSGITGSGSTGLVSGTFYNSTITVDGIPFNIFVDGVTAPTYNDLIDVLFSETDGNVIATIVGGNLRLTAASGGVDSTIAVSELVSPGLLSSLTNYTSVSALTAGTTTASVEYRDGKFYVLSNTAGTGSAVTIAAGSTGTDLIAALGLTITNQTVSTDYDYKEVGTPLRYGTSVLFPGATSISDKYEFIVQPFGLLSSAGGIYV